MTKWLLWLYEIGNSSIGNVSIMQFLEIGIASPSLVATEMLMGPSTGGALGTAPNRNY